jgi:uncharacterized protein YcsI (UPF0317 family)
MRERKANPNVVCSVLKAHNVTRAGTFGTSTWSEGHLQINLILKNACQYAELILGLAVLQPFLAHGWTLTQ